MSRRCDEPGEMPNPELLDDEVIEAILSGRRSAPPVVESLVEFSRDVRTVAERPVPRPSASLAAVLSAGFSTDKGDLLVTAASNVPGPATKQVAGLPKWRKSNSMLPTTGLLSGLVAKIVAGVTAGLAGLTAAGAAGALPGPAQDAVASVINVVSPFTLPDGDTSASVGADIGTNPAGPGVDISVGTSGPAATNVTAGASTAGGGAQASASTSAASTTAGGANANLGAGTSTLLPNIPGVPNLQNLPIPVPQCVKDIIDLNTGLPKVALDQIATQVTACVRSLMSLSTTQLPVNTNQCVSAVLNMVTSIGTNPGSVPNLSGIDFTQCVPVDISKCMSSVMNLMQNLPFGSLGSLGSFGFGLGGSAGTGGASAGASTSGIPGLSGLNLEGCIPFDLEACLSSLLSMAGNLPGVPTGGIPGLGSGSLPSVGNLDLSACVPLGSLGSIPGLGSLSGFLPR